MIKLGINVDHIATVRQARRGKYPVPLEIALLAQKAGADGITVHLREDRRHIQLQDVLDMKAKLTIKLNLEMALDDEIVKIACDVIPDDVCLVPEKRQELTTEGGLDVIANACRLEKVIKILQEKGICVSLFIDPNKDQVLMAKKLGANAIELHTGTYAENSNVDELNKIKFASKIAVSEGLILNAGHGLNYENVGNIAKIDGMNELNIGHSIVSYAFYVGIERAVKEMKELMK